MVKLSILMLASILALPAVDAPRSHGALPAPSEDVVITVLTENGCSQQQAVVLVPGFGVNSDFFNNLATRFNGQDAPCFSKVYTLNYRNVSDGYVGIKDTNSIEGKLIGWSSDIEETLQTVNSSQTWDTAPVVVGWSSGNLAVQYMLQQQLIGNTAYPATPLAAYYSLEGVPSIDVSWPARDSGLWSLEMTALHPLILDYSQQACVFSFGSQIWSLFLFSKPYTSLSTTGTSYSLLQNSTLPSPEEVVFEMTGIARTNYNLEGGMTNQTCKQSRFTTTLDDPTVIHDIDPQLFNKLTLPVVFIGGTKDIVIPASITKNQTDYFCMNSTTPCTMSIIQDAPHAGFSSDEYTTTNSQNQTVPIADVVAQIMSTY